MSSANRPGYAQLQDVILDADFPELDLALRRGRHVDRDDVAWYALLGDAQEHLEAFYRRYGCELIHKPDGYYYLLPTGDKLSRRQLGAGDMLVGQALALLYLHPSTIERGGLVAQEDVIAQLAAVLGSDALIRAFNPKRKRYDERVAQKTVRNRVAEAIRRLESLGFVDVAEGEQLRLRAPLLRFAEPVRGLSEPAEALAKLVAEGEVSLDEGQEGEGEGDASDSDGDAEGDGSGSDGDAEGDASDSDGDAEGEGDATAAEAPVASAPAPREATPPSPAPPGAAEPPVASAPAPREAASSSPAPPARAPDEDDEDDEDDDEPYVFPSDDPDDDDDFSDEDR
ncbi:MAG: chromosome partition protein MukE [Kofleriaceae bacterium]